MNLLTCIALDDDELYLSFVTSLIADIEWLDLKGKYSNSVKAASAIIKEEPDVLFMDYEMPYVDVYGMIDWILPRLKEMKKQPKIIIISGKDNIENQENREVLKHIRKDMVRDVESFEEIIKKLLF